jgi:hypothetical protein
MFGTELASYLSRASGERWEYAACTDDYHGRICGRYVSLKQGDAIRVVNLYAELREIVLKDGNLMRALLARMTKLYGRKFVPDAADGDGRRHARQKSAEVIMATMRYFTDMSSNSKWNDLVARYLSMPEGRYGLPST